jgi:hypothetical protein
MVWQIGYSEPPMHGLHRQIAPLSYQQASVGSSQSPAAACDVAGHALGNGSASEQYAGGCVTDHDPFEQSAAMRHAGRRSSPQLHWAAANPSAELATVHELPEGGGWSGHDEVDAPPDPEPPAADPAFPDDPACAAPAPPSPMLPAAPPDPLLLVPPPQPSSMARGKQRPS